MLHVFPILIAGLSAIGTAAVIASLVHSGKDVEPVMPSRAPIDPPVRSVSAKTLPTAATMAALPKSAGNKEKKNKKAGAGAGGRRKQATAAIGS